MSIKSKTGRLGALLTVAIMLGAGSAAQAVVIDFESLTHAGSGTAIHGTTYSEDGYTFTKGFGEPFPFENWGTNSAFFNGSTGLFNNTIGGITTLARTDAGNFNALSIDLDGIFGTSSVVVNFIGNLFGGGTVLQSFTTDGALGAETFAFSGFTNLTSLTWLQQSPFHQFDNINVTTDVTAVAEPGALALFGLGLLGLGYARRRKVA